MTDVEILVVEDSPTQAEHLRHTLEQQGCAVEVARDGTEALRLLQERRPDVVISDVNMPGMDGYQLCRRIKDGETTGNVPVILLTSLSDPHDVIRGLESGADTFITKPYAGERLLSRVGHILSGRMRGLAGDSGGEAVEFEGRQYRIMSDRRQILSFLLSTYETAVEKSTALEQANRELREAQDVQAEQAKELRALSLRDELTRLHNRRGFVTLAEQQVRIAKRNGTPLAVFYADLDGMKPINDTLGHEEGDHALVDVAEALTDTFRESDIVARIGGDEFAVLQVGGSPDAAGILIARLRATLDERNRNGGRPYELSLSVGLAWLDPAHPCSLGELMRIADEHMYENKKGRKLAG